MDPQDRDSWQEEPLSDTSQEPEASGEPLAPRGGKLRRLFGSAPVIATLTMLLLMAVAALSWYATQWKRGVRVERVVVSGASLIPVAALDKRLARFRELPLEEVRIDDVRRALAPEPYIRSMTVSKELNGILRVVIEERKPAALLVEGERRRIIDTEGAVLPDEGVSGRFHRLVKVSGVRRLTRNPGDGVRRLNDSDRELLFALLDAFATASHAGLMLSEIHLVPNNLSWFSVAGSPIRFIVGNDGDFKEKLKKFEIFWQKVLVKKGIDSYESVDLRFRDRVFARQPEAEVETAPSGVLPASPEDSLQTDESH
ncbi:MAG: cell division protein FtsQ/DivIB [Chlorobiaceae bacterium]|nr:cell division protein FtsQ/DivIB [Chlorobiaceae bacterium]